MHRTRPTREKAVRSMIGEFDAENVTRVHV
jgi:hypothetical protein